MIIGSKYGMPTADNICILQILATVGIHRGHNKCESSANFPAGCHLSKFKISRKVHKSCCENIRKELKPEVVKCYKLGKLLKIKNTNRRGLQKENSFLLSKSTKK